MPFDSLPQDIIYLIVDSIKTIDIKTIHAFCLVCRALVVPCQKHIFSSITLTTPLLIMRTRKPLHGRPTEHPSEGLYQSFQRNPELMTYIRELKVVYLGETFDYFAVLLRRLRECAAGLRHLEVHLSIGDIKMRDEKKKAGVRVVMELARLPQLCSLEVNVRASCACGFPFGFLGTVGPGIRRLGIMSPSSCEGKDGEVMCTVGEGVDEDEGKDKDVTPQPLHVIDLQGINIEIPTSYFTARHSAFHLGQLRCVVLRGLISLHGSSGLSRFLRRSSSSLRVIAWLDPQTESEVPNLRSHTNLHTAVISISIASRSRFFPRFLECLPRTLQHIVLFIRHGGPFRGAVVSILSGLVNQLHAHLEKEGTTPRISVHEDIQRAGYEPRKGRSADQLVSRCFAPLTIRKEVAPTRQYDPWIARMVLKKFELDRKGTEEDVERYVEELKRAEYRD